jgi:hypothetical protein
MASPDRKLVVSSGDQAASGRRRLTVWAAHRYSTADAINTHAGTGSKVHVLSTWTT